jgi:hypothetical protein
MPTMHTRQTLCMPPSHNSIIMYPHARASSSYLCHRLECWLVASEEETWRAKTTRASILLGWIYPTELPAHHHRRLEDILQQTSPT